MNVILRFFIRLKITINYIINLFYFLASTYYSIQNNLSIPYSKYLIVIMTIVAVEIPFTVTARDVNTVIKNRKP